MQYLVIIIFVFFERFLLPKITIALGGTEYLELAVYITQILWSRDIVKLTRDHGEGGCVYYGRLQAALSKSGLVLWLPIISTEYFTLFLEGRQQREGEEI